jgi:hypothetical protein
MTLIISGASTLVDNAWPTWVTFIEKKYNVSELINLSRKGLGNKAILLRAIALAHTVTDPYVIVQLTNVDKWDWYVEEQSLLDQLSNEKHSIAPIADNNTHGFWSTGSHFPLLKEYYQRNYFSLEYSSFETLLLLQWFLLLCKQKSWKYLVLFDSPILSVTEAQLNQGTLAKEDCWSKSLVENSLCQGIFPDLNLTEVYLPGMIGHACLNNKTWFSKKYKNHPGSLIHYLFAVDKIFPILDRTFPQNNCQDLLCEATKFNKLAYMHE